MSVMEKLEELEARIEELEGRWHRYEEYLRTLMEVPKVETGLKEYTGLENPEANGDVP